MLPCFHLSLTEPVVLTEAEAVHGEGGREGSGIHPDGRVPEVILSLKWTLESDLGPGPGPVLLDHVLSYKP